MVEVRGSIPLGRTITFVLNMATIMTHALVAGTFYKASILKHKKILFFCLLGSILPDADVIGFKFGIAYEHPLGHRGFTHSILFALMYSCFLTYCFRKSASQLKLFVLFFTSIMSHGILDMLTNGGLGVGLFIPFENSRYFFPWTPLEVSPIGRHFFSKRGLEVITNEILYVGVPCLVLFIFYKIKMSVFKKEE